MTLRDLLLFQSIIACRHQFDIVKLINQQVRIEIFLQAFLEFDKSNLVQILAFDSKSIEALLSEKHAHLY